MPLSVALSSPLSLSSSWPLSSSWAWPVASAGAIDGVAFFAVAVAGGKPPSFEKILTFSNFVWQNRIMAPQATSYHLTKHLLDAYDQLPVSRSLAMRRAIEHAHQDDTCLARALVRRVTNPTRNIETIKISARLDDEYKEQLTKLSQRAQLPIEHTLRLAMEAYIFNL